MTVEDKFLEYDRRLSEMQKQIDNLNSEMASLKNTQNVLKASPQAYSLPTSTNAPARANVVNQPNINTRAITYSTQQPSVQPNNVSQTVKAKEKTNKSIENAIGKQWMGIFASVLIFISVIMFATIIAPNLGDGIKLTVMYIFSIGVTAFGVFKLHKNKNNSFFLSILGCGIGLIFISLLMSNIYFKVMNELVLYALILVWSVGVCLVSRYNNYIFQIIGQLGIVVSISFGTYLCCDRKDDVKIVVLAVFLLLTELIFFFSHRKKRAAQNAVSHISTALNSFILLSGAAYLKSIPALGLILLLVVVVYNGSLCLFEDGKEDGYLGAVGVVYSFIIFITDMCFMKAIALGDGNVFCLSYFIFAEIIALIHYRKISKLSSNMIKIVSFVVTLFAAWNMGASSISLIILSVVASVLAIAFKDVVYQYIGVVLGLAFVTFYSMDDGYAMYISSIIVVIVAIITLIKHYNQGIKGVILASIYIYICKILADDPFDIEESNSVVVLFSIISILHIVAIKVKLAINFVTKEYEKGFFTYLTVINAILMFAGLGVISNAEELLFVAIIVTLALFMVNAPMQLNYKEFFVNMYVGIKFTILLIVILNALSAETIVISIACLLFAIVCIVGGAFLKKRALRVYGLILSNISIIKLIIFDYNYENAIGRAVGFLLSGILCFAISFIYTMIEKKNNN